MVVPGYWAEPFLDRQRTHMFSPTLDWIIGEDDPVRLVDEILAGVDWSNWDNAEFGCPVRLISAQYRCPRNPIVYPPHARAKLPFPDL